MQNCTASEPGSHKLPSYAYTGASTPSTTIAIMSESLRMLDDDDMVQGVHRFA